jgi:hypothetical protein
MGYVTYTLILVTWEVMGARANEVKSFAKGLKG